MIILDSLLIGGIKFVLDKVATAVDEEMNDETSLRQELLAAQMRFELGEISEEELAGLETAVMARLREIREREREEAGAGSGAMSFGSGGFGVDITFTGDEPEEER
jgi:hypothetical protein